MNNKKPDIKSMDLTELTEFITAAGQKPFRGRQLYQWMHQKCATSIDEMTNLPKAFRDELKEGCTYTVLKQANVQASTQDGTRKYLFLLEDGNMVESVFMRYKTGNSVCISSQAGCRMGCKFCASAIDGLSRNLTPSEMLEQVYQISRDTGERVSNVVVMGTGEPLDNYDNLLQFLTLLCNEDGIHMSQRNVTVSTCGLVPQILELARKKLQITLAISLHAASQQKRCSLMPVANRYGIEDLMAACRYYFEMTGRRITFEYSLFAGVNDSKEDATMLCGLLSGMNCHVNLIPVNPVKGHEFVPPGKEGLLSIKKHLEQKGIPVTVRRTLGSDIDAACGQLRKKYMEIAEKSPLS